jgi:lysine biosynthesis protein LysW
LKPILYDFSMPIKHPIYKLGYVYESKEPACMFFKHCPVCQGNIGVAENPEIGQSVICPDCGNVFEVVWLFPLTLGDPSNNADYVLCSDVIEVIKPGEYE